MHNFHPNPGHNLHGLFEFKESFDLLCKILDEECGDLLDLTEFDNEYPTAANYFFSHLPIRFQHKLITSELNELFREDGIPDKEQVDILISKIQDQMVSRSWVDLILSSPCISIDYVKLWMGILAK